MVLNRRRALGSLAALGSAVGIAAFAPGALADNGTTQIFPTNNGCSACAFYVYDSSCSAEPGGQTACQGVKDENCPEDPAGYETYSFGTYYPSNPVEDAPGYTSGPFYAQYPGDLCGSAAPEAPDSAQLPPGGG